MRESFSNFSEEWWNKTDGEKEEDESTHSGKT